VEVPDQRFEHPPFIWHEHINHFTPIGIAKMAERVKLKIEKQTMMGYKFGTECKISQMYLMGGM
jgi:hypothetical protein